MKKSLTCIVCPIGCNMEAQIEEGRIARISGNRCGRGVDYTRQEITDPRRYLTTTMINKSGDILPVRTEREISKEKIFEVAQKIHHADFQLPVTIGQVMIENVDAEGTNVIATANLVVSRGPVFGRPPIHNA